MFADAVTTVSNTYAEEIKTPFYGEKLDGLMCARANSLRGIVNGIDYNEFNPETDPYITKTYNATTFRKREKLRNKTSAAERSWIAGRSEDDDGRYCITTDRSERV